MIPAVSVDSSFPPLGPEAIAAIEEDILLRYPNPLSVAWRNVSQAADPTARTSILFKDLLSTLLQHLALLAVHDYANSEARRSFRVFAAIETMLLRPGPGKWLGFLREITDFWGEQDAAPALPGVIDFVRRHLLSRASRIAIEDAQRTNKLPALEALVYLRNRWAHSKHLEQAKAVELCERLMHVMRHLLSHLAFLKDCPLILSHDGRETPLVGSAVPATRCPGEVCLRLPGQTRPMLKLVCHWPVDRTSADVFLLEEVVQDRQLLYSSSLRSINLRRNKPEEKPVVETVLDLLERLRAEDSVLRVDRLDFQSYAARCNAFSTGIYSDFRESGKYAPDLYLAPEPLASTLPAFLDASEPIHLVAGAQGSGKSALACHWVKELLHRQERAAPHAVLLLESHRWSIYESPRDIVMRGIRDALQLDDAVTWPVLLGRVGKDLPEGARLVFVIDAVNEFQSLMSVRPVYSRPDLLRDLIRMIADYREQMRGKVKLILTLRWDLLEKDGLGPGRFEEEYVGAGLFFGPDGRLFSEVPRLDPPQVSELYGRLREAHIGMSPRFEWEQVPKPLQEACSVPMMLQILTRSYDGQAIDALDVKTPRQLEMRFVKTLFLPARGDSKEKVREKAARCEVVRCILDAMKGQRTEHLVLDAGLAENDPSLARLLEILSRTERGAESGATTAHTLRELEERQVLRTELVRSRGTEKRPPLPAKRISFTHELVSRFLVENSQALSAAVLRKSFVFAFALLPLVVLAAAGGAVANRSWSLLAAMGIFLVTALPILGGIPRLMRGCRGMRQLALDQLLGPEDMLQQYETLSIDDETGSRSVWVGTCLMSACFLAVLPVGWKMLTGRVLMGGFAEAVVMLALVTITSYITIIHLLEGIVLISIGSRAQWTGRIVGRDMLAHLMDGILRLGVCLPCMVLLLEGGVWLSEWAALALGDPVFLLRPFLAATPPLRPAWLLAWPICLIVGVVAIRAFCLSGLRLWMRRQTMRSRKWPEDAGRFLQQGQRVCIVLAVMVSIGILLLGIMWP